TSYSRGINGIMIDFAALPGDPTADDFQFKVGNDDNPDAWPAAPKPIHITVRTGEGVGGSDRVAIEGEGPEICRIDLTGLDCVTFFENVLCIARIIKKRKTTFDDFKAEVTFTRYRGGMLTDYTSRLHYTSDWIYDNEKKKVVKNITKDIGGEKHPVKIFFMSKNPHFYQALNEFPEFIETMAKIEREISSRQHWYIPRGKVEEAQKSIQTGDIIALATKKEGLDFAHTGLAYKNARGKLRLLHASQNEGEVILDKELFEYLRLANTHPGIAVARPLEVK
ncbi:MAG: DUF1460 domain-containing protein, partial [Candidatus Aminicenantes bacterium]